MIKIDGDMLRKLQMTQLEMLIEVDRICRKYNINYSLDGGTLLGAVRHDGFIPWDDDADVVMLRHEYELFFEACKKELNTEKFFLQEFRTDEYYRWGYSKLRRNGTLFLRESQEHGNWHQGVFIDIFVYDQVPDNFFLRRIHLFLCYCIRKGLYSEVGKKSEKNRLYRLWFRIINLIPRKFWVEAIDIIQKYSNKKYTKLVRHMTYPYRKKCRYGLPRKCFDDYIEKDFEKYNFKIFKDYDSYLSNLYGNYMVLPPEKDRKVHPVSKIELMGVSRNQ